jgi:2'-5' RNA ligase
MLNVECRIKNGARVQRFKYFKTVAEESTTERFRLFVAIPVPDAVRKDMIRVQRELQPLAPPGAVRWTKPEQFHLTLRFLGDVPSDRAGALQESVRAVCSGTPVLRLRAKGVGFFPNARSPRVVWVGVTDDENRLVDLQKQIESAIRPFTAEPGGDRFAGHVTLGRLNRFNILRINDLTTCVEAMKKRMFGEWLAREIEIVRSELSATGSRYTPLTTLRLGMEIASV